MNPLLHICSCSALRVLFVLAIAASVSVARADDNCCYLAGWTCTTESEWRAGYYAAAANQCDAEQESDQSSTQNSEGSEATVDNCCFTGWSCTTDDEWKAGYLAYQANQCSGGSQAQTNGQSGGQSGNGGSGQSSNSGVRNAPNSNVGKSNGVSGASSLSLADACANLARLGLHSPTCDCLT